MSDDRFYPDGASIILASREDSERYDFRTPDNTRYSTPATSEEQARKLAADSFTDADPGDFELITDYCEHDRPMMCSCTTCGRSWMEEVLE